MKIKNINIPKNEYINLVIRIIVGFIFILTGISKIVDPALFAREISNYDMMYLPLINLMAITLPWVELVVGILFILGVRVKANIILLAAMLLMFNFAVAVAWARGLDINCGCYSSVAEQTVGFAKLAENFAMFAALAFMYFFPNNKLSLEYFVRAEVNA
jgi:uncharacterized membrane protein YphA (DoxX/SURF4 family)